MSPTTNEIIARRVFEDGLNGRDASVFEELVAPDHVNHERADMLVEATGPKDWSDVLARLSAAFPDVSWTVLRVLAQDDDVWVETRMSGAHEGTFFGIAPTGRDFAVRQVHMLRVADGLIREHWAVRDDLGVLVQLGAIEPSRTSTPRSRARSAPSWPPRRRASSRERLRGGRDDLVVRHVAEMLTDVPAVPEGVLELAVPVAPERVLQGLAHLGPRRHGPGEDGVGVGDVEGQDDRRAADAR